MDTLIDSIRAAVADGAPDDTKRAGADACRAILAALAATAGQPLAAEPIGPAAPPADRPRITPTAAGIATAIAALRDVPGDQLLDLAIAKLRALMPLAETATASHAFRVPLLPLPPQLGVRGGGA